MRLTLAVYLFFYRISRRLIHRPPLSLRLLLSGVFALLLLLLITLFSFLVELIATRHMQADTRGQLTQLAATMTDRLDRTMFERYREIKLIADTYELFDEASATPDERREFFTTIQRHYPDYAWLGFVDTSGKIISATEGGLEGESVAQCSWFLRAREELTIEDSDTNCANFQTRIATSTIRPTLLFANLGAPILSADGQLRGVLAAQINWESGREIKTSVYRPVDTESLVEVFVFRQNGELILAPPTWQAQHVEKPVFLTNMVSSLTKFLRTNQSKFGNDILHWPDDDQYLVGFAESQGYRTYPGLGWMVVVRQPVSRAFASIPFLQRVIYFAGGLSILLFGLASWLLTSRLTRQLQAITDSAERIRRGDPNVSIPLLSGSKEIATLSDSLHQLVEDLTTATTAERNRIARDLHDSVTQTLFSASLLAEVIPKLWEADPERGRIKLDELRRSVRGALAEMRTLLLELRPVALTDAEMSRLLRQLADATNGRSGIAVKWSLAGACEPPPDVKVAFYRTVQEALNNVVKHSKATEVEVLLQCDKTQSLLTICDNGCGFVQENISGDHLGLRMMRERIEAIGGVLTISSKLNQGTEVRVQLDKQGNLKDSFAKEQSELIATDSGISATTLISDRHIT